MLSGYSGLVEIASVGGDLNRGAYIRDQALQAVPGYIAARKVPTFNLCNLPSVKGPPLKP